MAVGKPNKVPPLCAKDFQGNGLNARETPCRHAKKVMLMYAADNAEGGIYEGNERPSHVGILRPGLRLRSMSMRPHLSSHSLPLVL